MTELDWQAIYRSELQSLYALWLAPLAFLAYRASAAPDWERARVPEAARFVSGLTLLFAFETMLDPLATGPLLDGPPFEGSFAESLVPFVFVYLGDLRVLWLVAGIARPDRGAARNLALSAAATLVVPVVAGSLFAGLRWIRPDAHGQLLWILYEAGFLLLCIVAARAWGPRSLPAGSPAFGPIRAILGYSAAYYALWLVADLFIVGAGLDLGWALRMVPNQLYYAFWVPFVYVSFFSGPAPSAPKAAR